MEKKTGTVAWFNTVKGLGFITPAGGGKDYFVHYSNINMPGFKSLQAGDIVEFEVGQNHAGDQAVNITVVKQ